MSVHVHVRVNVIQLIIVLPRILFDWWYNLDVAVLHSTNILDADIT